MAIRSLVISGLALAGALIVAQPGRAQGFFSSYEMSPRQIVGILEDDGYEIRGPMVRRGDVYVCDVISVSGQAAQVIVSVRDGRVVGRYAERGQRWRDYADAPRVARPPRSIGDDDRNGNWDDDNGSRHQMALGDLFNPPSRVYGGEPPFASKPDSEDAPIAKPKHHAMKKHPSVAKAPSTTAPTPDAASDKPGATPSPSVAAVAPSAPAEAKKPDAVKTEAPAAAAPPPPATAAPEPAQKKAETEKAPAPEPTSVSSPKPEGPRKKINDLPVGTLD